MFQIARMSHSSLNTPSGSSAVRPTPAGVFRRTMESPREDVVFIAAVRVTARGSTPPTPPPTRVTGFPAVAPDRVFIAASHRASRTVAAVVVIDITPIVRSRARFRKRSTLPTRARAVVARARAGGRRRRDEGHIDES